MAFCGEGGDARVGDFTPSQIQLSQVTAFGGDRDDGGVGDAFAIGECKCSGPTKGLHNIGHNDVSRILGHVHRDIMQLQHSSYPLYR